MKYNFHTTPSYQLTTPTHVVMYDDGTYATDSTSPYPYGGDGDDRVQVRGYTRSNGTVVSGYSRSGPTASVSREPTQYTTYSRTDRDYDSSDTDHTRPHTRSEPMPKATTWHEKQKEIQKEKEVRQDKMWRELAEASDEMEREYSSRTSYSHSSYLISDKSEGEKLAYEFGEKLAKTLVSKLFGFLEKEQKIPEQKIKSIKEQKKEKSKEEKSEVPKWKTELFGIKDPEKHPGVKSIKEQEEDAGKLWYEKDKRVRGFLAPKDIDFLERQRIYEYTPAQIKWMRETQHVMDDPDIMFKHRRIQEHAEKELKYRSDQRAWEINNGDYGKVKDGVHEADPGELIDKAIEQAELAKRVEKLENQVKQLVEENAKLKAESRKQ